METYIALLRGINVSGQKMIKMEELKNVLGELGFTGITTYIQSGNILFKCVTGDPDSLAAAIADKILQRFGFAVPVVIRTLAELDCISRNNPFVRGGNIDTGKMHVTFLSEKPGAENESKTGEYKFSPDEFAVKGKEVYLYCPDGYGRTKLTNQFFESKLKVTATTRNWNTVLTLVNMGRTSDEKRVRNKE
jgi:uncharacterized protein (DUF1697 family)